MKNLPSFESYGKYESDNYGVNTLKFYIGNITLYYSYRTIVAFHTYQDGLVVHRNDWSVTTGKHLNWIDGGNRANRVDDETFQKMLQAALEKREAREVFNTYLCPDGHFISGDQYTPGTICPACGQAVTNQIVTP